MIARSLWLMMLLLLSGCCEIFGLCSTKATFNYSPLNPIVVDNGQWAGAQISSAGGKTQLIATETRPQYQGSFSESSLSVSSSDSASFAVTLKKVFGDAGLGISSASDFYLSDLQTVIPANYDTLPLEGEWVYSALLAGCYGFTSTTASSAAIQAGLNASTPTNLSIQAQANALPAGASAPTCGAAGSPPGPSGAAPSSPPINTTAGQLSVSSDNHTYQVQLGANVIVGIWIAKNGPITSETKTLNFAPPSQEATFGDWTIKLIPETDSSGLFTGEKYAACVSLDLEDSLLPGYPHRYQVVCPGVSNIAPAGIDNAYEVPPGIDDTKGYLVPAGSSGGKLCKLKFDWSGTTVVYQKPQDNSWETDGGHLTPISASNLNVTLSCTNYTL